MPVSLDAGSDSTTPSYGGPATLELVYLSEISYLVAAVTILHEFLLSFEAELRLVWTCKSFRSVAAWLYIANRILLLLYAITALWNFQFYTHRTSCESGLATTDIPATILILMWAVFSMLRVYAIGGKSLSLAGVVFAISLVPFAVNVYVTAMSTSLEVPFKGGFVICFFNVTRVPKAHLTILEIISISCLIIGDSIVMAVTWHQTSATIRAARAMDVEAPLLTMLLRDGTFYFGSLLILNVAVLGAYLTLDTNLGLQSGASAWTSLVISRFLLSLRDHNGRTSGLGEATTMSLAVSDFPDVNFAAIVVDSMAGPVSTFGFGSDNGHVDRSGSEEVHSECEVEDLHEIASSDGHIRSMETGYEEV